MTDPTATRYADRVYAGVLGKILGVYTGRPVEGWTYDAIRERFGEVDYFVAEALGVPLVVPDDDISGTFVFARAILDNVTVTPLSPADVGRTWLNYIVDNRTVLWWGGLARSTEHTAFLRLKDGVAPPRSGSIELNGRSMAEGIGAQIFIDGWALASPGDPDQAVRLARAAASVSHDGFAIESAAFIAAMEAAAFEEHQIGALIDIGLGYVTDERVLRLVTETVEQCRLATDWRAVREWIEREHGYSRYPGNSPAATNLAAVLMALLMAGDDFHRSLGIITSAGWDTDSNAGNVGCLNGVRLGLEGIDAGADLRGPVADQVLIVSADGGECVSDAVLETRKLLASATALRGEPAPPTQPRFFFELPGSVQGWQPYRNTAVAQALTRLTNVGDGLRIEFAGLARGARAATATTTFAAPAPMAQAGTSMFEVIASPSLYPTQRIRAVLAAESDPRPDVSFFVEHYGDDGALTKVTGRRIELERGDNEIVWQVPATGGEAVYRLGLELISDDRIDGHVTLRSLDFLGAPLDLVLGRAESLSPTLTPWTTQTSWLRTFVSSATHFAPDYTTTFTVSHTGADGVVTTGTRDWQDYTVSSTITFNMHEAAGLVARARGHRRYYAAVLRAGRAQIVRRIDGVETVVADAAFPYEVDEVHRLDFTVQGQTMCLSVDGSAVCTGTDDALAAGGAGFLVERGSVLADGFRVRAGAS